MWTDTTTAFSNVKNALVNASWILVHPTSDAMIDASGMAVGAVLQQYIQGQ